MPYALTYDEHVAAVRRESAAFAAALRAGPMDATVPSCPEWTVTDLATHVGQFAGFWSHVLCDGTGRSKPAMPEPPEQAALADWFEELAAGLVTELTATAPATEVWTWVDEDDTASFVARRSAHELAIHRIDAQLAHGVHEPIEPALAADGIDETFLMVNYAAGHSGRNGATLHLHGTDDPAPEPHEWLVTFGEDAISMTHEHGKGDAAIRAHVSDLELLLYQRPPVGEVEVFGDPELITAFYHAFTF